MTHQELIEVLQKLSELKNIIAEIELFLLTEIEVNS